MPTFAPETTSAPSIEPPLLPSRDLLRGTTGFAQTITSSTSLAESRVQEIVSLGNDLRELNRLGRSVSTVNGVYVKFDPSVPVELQRQIREELTNEGRVEVGQHSDLRAHIAAEKERGMTGEGVRLATGQVEVSRGADGGLRYVYTNALPQLPGSREIEVGGMPLGRVRRGAMRAAI